MTELLKINSVSKYFPGVVALKDISFSLVKGKIYGLVGENGAGKSTFVKTLMGLYQPDEGEFFIKGKKANIPNPDIARKEYLIDTIFQEHSLIPQMSIAENIFLDRLEEYYENGLINHDKLAEDAKKALEEIGLDMDVTMLADEVTEGEKSLIELGKSLLRDPDLLILDEITAPLESNAVSDLFEIMKNLKERGKTLIFISHRLEEVLEICDEIMVFKDGNYEGIIKNRENGEKENSIRKKIIKKMTGKETGLSFPPKTGINTTSEVALSVRGLNNNCLKDIDLDIKKGEIVALAGLRGQGQSELLRTIVGLYPKEAGTVSLFDKELDIKHPKAAMENGIFYISDKRDIEELWLTHDVWLNISLTSINKRTKYAIIDKKEDKKVVENMIEKLGIETPSAAQLVRNLSGGNRQKVVLGKYLLAQPRFLLIDQPTMGLDVGAKTEIYKLLRDLSEKGIPTLAALTDLEEVVNLPDRVLVMREGKIENEFTDEVLNEEELLDSYYV